MIESLTIADRVLSVVAVLMPAALWHWVTARALSRGQTLFGARVPPGFVESVAGRAIVSEFRRRVWSWSLAFAVASEAASAVFPIELAVIVCPVSGWIAFALANSRARREAGAPSEPTVRVASLAAQNETETAWLVVLDWLAMLVPPLAPAATLVFLAFHWHQASGFREALIGLSVGVLCTANQWALLFRARSSDWAATPGASHRYRLYLGAMQAFVITSINCQLCAQVVTSILNPGSYFSSKGDLLFMALVLALGLKWRHWLTRHMAKQSSDQMSDACWKWGFLYFNPSDPALVVPERTGVGQSLNCARPSVWVVGAALLALPAACLISAMSGS